MREYLTALALALIPALGNFAGGLAAEAFQVSKRTLSLALHVAAGIILAVVGIELMGRAMEAEPPWVIVLALIAGGVASVALDKGVDLVRSRFGGSKSKAGPWMIYLGVSVDLFSDGLMIGTGSSLSFGLGLLLALGQVPADIPEGFATVATFRQQGVPRSRRLLIAASFALPILLGTTFGYWAVRGRPELVKLSLLAFTAGILIAVAVEEMVAQAHESRGESAEEDPLDSIALVAGFGLFALLSAYLD